MEIGGIQKTSLIDFPNEVSCVLFTQGCNFHCPYCHNKELILKSNTNLGNHEIFEFLHKRKNILDAVVITGGEPTLQNDIVDFCKEIKTLGYKIKLDTNGSNTAVLEKLIKEESIDYVAMDIKGNPERYSEKIWKNHKSKNIIKSINLLEKANIKHEFRIPCLFPFVNAEMAQILCKYIKCTSLIFLQLIKLENVLCPQDFKTELKVFSQVEVQAYKKLLEQLGFSQVSTR